MTEWLRLWKVVQPVPPQQGNDTSSHTVVVGNESVSPTLPFYIDSSPLPAVLFSPASIVAKRWGYFYASGKTSGMMRLHLSQAYHTA